MATNTSKIDSVSTGDHFYIKSGKNKDVRLVSITNLIKYFNETQEEDLIALNVADPTITGVDANLHVEGYTNETPPRYFKKVGLNDTDWEFIAITEGGALTVNYVLADGTGIVVPLNALAVVGGQVRLGDGATTEGLVVSYSEGRHTYIVDPAYDDGVTTVVGVAGNNIYATVTAAIEAAIVDDPPGAHILIRSGQINPNLRPDRFYTADTASDVEFSFEFQNRVELYNGNNGFFIDNTTGDLSVISFGGYLKTGAIAINQPGLYKGPGSKNSERMLRFDFSKANNIESDANARHLVELTGGYAEMTGYHLNLGGPFAAAQTSLFLVENAYLMVRKAFCRAQDFAPNNSWLIEAGSNGIVFFDNCMAHHLSLGNATDATARFILKDCYHHTSSSTPIAFHVSGSTAQFVGTNYSTNAYDVDATQVTTFGSFTQANPSALMV